MKILFKNFYKDKNNVMECLLSLAKTMPSTPSIAEMDFFIDASKIMDSLFAIQNGENNEPVYWILRNTGSDFCQNKESFDNGKAKKCNKVGFAKITGTGCRIGDDFFIEFYLF